MALYAGGSRRSVRCGVSASLQDSELPQTVDMGIGRVLNSSGDAFALIGQFGDTNTRANYELLQATV